MGEFPAAYEPFLPFIEKLSLPLAEALRGQLHQFEVLARGLERKDAADQGEFEGLSGLTHRGDLEHILQSELLLQSEAPMEFLRRLAETETLYHDRVFADPGASPIWRVVISCGPDILGHGRLVVLAALFFLARVAAQRGARFYWCFLPREEGAVWFNYLSVNTIKRFLRSAAYREASVDDIEGARACWAEATGEEHLGRDTEMSDWVIGSGRDWGDRATVSAPSMAPGISTQPNTLTYTLAPPIFSEPRQIEIAVRRKGQGSRRVDITLADDADCLRALEKPFPVPRGKGKKRKQDRHQVPDMLGWEPRYLSTPSGLYRAIRLATGVLIQSAVQRGAQSHWYLPLDQDTHLVGLDILQSDLKVLCHRKIAGEQRLLYHSFHLVPDESQTTTALISHAVQCESLFANRPDYALPSLTLATEVEFYSTAGLAYQLRDNQMSANPQSPMIVMSIGMHRAVHAVRNAQAGLEVLKRGLKNHGWYFELDRMGMPDAFHGMVWSPSDSSFAYAVEPCEWRVNPNRSRFDASDPNLEFRIEPEERVLKATAKSDGVQAVIWSDVAYGGDGTVETYLYANDRRSRQKASFDLGEDADKIASMTMSNAKVLAIACDDQRQPEKLIVFSPHTSSKTTKSETFLLDELRQSAATLLFEEGGQA